MRRYSGKTVLIFEFLVITILFGIASCLLIRDYNYNEIIFLVAYVILLAVHSLGIMWTELQGQGLPRSFYGMKENEIFELVGSPVIEGSYYFAFVRDRDGRIWAVEIPKIVGRLFDVFKIVDGKIVEYPKKYMGD